MLAYSATSGATTSTFVPLTDVLGSTLGLVNSSGSLATQYSYEPFGVPTTSAQSSNYPYLFAGMEYDAATGLYHTPARYYSPRLQRCLSEDPLQFGGGDANLFGYAGNDPVNLSDSLGLYCAYGSTAPLTSPGTFGDVAGGAIGSVAVGALLGDDLGHVSAGGSAVGASGVSGVRPTGATTLAVMGVNSGQIVLAQAEGPPPEDDEGEEGSLSPEAVGEWLIHKHRGQFIASQAALGIGDFDLPGRQAMLKRCRRDRILWVLATVCQKTEKRMSVKIDCERFAYPASKSVVGDTKRIFSADRRHLAHIKTTVT